MKSVKPKAYLYSRVSALRQGLHGEGIEGQRELGIKFIEEHGYELADEIEDIGKSACKGHNLNDDAGLGYFLTLREQGKIEKGSLLTIEQLDRISRQGHDKSRCSNSDLT